VPQLNAFGHAFMRAGFRLPGARGVFPVTVKVAMAYSSGADDPDTDTERLPKTIVDEVELLSAGSLGPNASYYFEQYAVDGGFPGRPRDMWVQLDRRTGAADPLGSALHARLGEFTLPLPVDPETERPTLAHYAIFDQSVGANPFTLFDTQIGTDLSFTKDRAGVDSHLVFMQAYDRSSGIPSDGVDVMGTIAKTVGENVTAYVYRYQGQRALEPQHDWFYRQGYAAACYQGKFDITGLIQQGYDTSAYGNGIGASSSGGFLQAAWHFSSAINLYARYDETYEPFQPRQSGTTLSLILRPAPNMRFTLEGTHESDRTDELRAGLLFAY
jgi:hypothetical protein